MSIFLNSFGQIINLGSVTSTGGGGFDVNNVTIFDDFLGSDFRGPIDWHIISTAGVFYSFTPNPMPLYNSTTNAMGMFAIQKLSPPAAYDDGLFCTTGPTFDFGHATLSAEIRFATSQLSQVGNEYEFMFGFMNLFFPLGPFDVTDGVFFLHDTPTTSGNVHLVTREFGNGTNYSGTTLPLYPTFTKLRLEVTPGSSPSANLYKDGNIVISTTNDVPVNANNPLYLVIYFRNKTSTGSDVNIYIDYVMINYQFVNPR